MRIAFGTGAVGLVAAAALCAGRGECADAIAKHAVFDSEFESTGAAIQDFRDKIGDDARQYDWESTPDDVASPNDFPGDYLNTAVGFGFSFSTTGVGRFRVSASSKNPAHTPMAFGDFDPAAPSELRPYSGERMFTPLDGRSTFVQVFVPGTRRPAVTRALGFTFVGVQKPNLTKVEYFHGSRSLGVFYAPPGGDSAGPSFVGVVFDDPVITSALVTLPGRIGDAENLKPLYGDAIVDVVAMDDVVWAAPLPSADLHSDLKALREGANVVYTTTTTNVSPYDGTDVALQVQLPPDVSVLTSSPGATIVDGVVSWSIGALGSGASVSRFVQVAPRSEGFHPATAVATSWADGDPDDDGSKLVAVPSQYVAEATYESAESRLRELASIAKTLGLPSRTGASLSAAFAKSRKFAIAAAARSNAGKTSSAAARLRSAASALTRVQDVLDSRGAQSLDVYVANEILVRTYALETDLRLVKP